MSSTTPLRPLMPASNPSTSSRSPNPSLLSGGQHAAQINERNLASSSASSSQVGMSDKKRVDQVIHRLYLKTVNVLVDGRLAHNAGTLGPGQSSTSEKKQDKWFNLSLPDTDLYRSDLALYRHVSTFQPYTERGTSTPSPESCTIPPLLIAFILDTSDLPNGQALLWNRDGGKIPLNTNLLGNKGKGKEKERRAGIVLERWTFRAQLSAADAASSSQAGPHIAYRLGIIHFRALYSLIRLLPTYRLFRRLRRANNGIRMGLKLWAPEGYPNTSEGLAEAWEVMERGLVGLDTGLDELVSGEEVDHEEIQRYDLPKLDMFGNEYTLSTEYRPEVDFNVEDMEAVLSEKFVDMDEDWFKPTVARSNSRADTESGPSSVDSRSAPSVSASRKFAGPTPIPSTQSPIPQRQQALHPGSLLSAGGGSISGSKPRSSAGSRVPSSQREKLNVGSIGTDRWGPLGEGLPFAGPASGAGQGDTQGQPPSPSMATPAAILAARRLSGHSIQPFASASPSASLLRSTPPQQYQSGAPIPTASTSVSARPVIGSSRPSSIGRTSSFLSQSGRSYTHAQIANMYAGSASPPVTGAMSGIGVQIPASSPLPGQSPVSPSSLSFTKQPVPRSISGRPLYMTPSSSSPFIPGSLDKEPSSVSSATGQPGIIKRYSSSLSQRSGRAITGTSTGVAGSAIAGSQGSSVDGSPSVGQSLLRRTSTRESGLRHSLEGPTTGTGSGSSSRLPAPDEDDIQAFLKTLDALPQPPSLAAQAAQTSRSHLPSTSSSLSNPSAGYQPSPSAASGSGSPGAAYHGRAPLTRQQVDDELRRLAGSFSLSSQVFSGVESPPKSSRASASTSVSTGPSSIGLLSASRPSSAARRVSTSEAEQATAQKPRPLYRRQTSGGRSPLGPGGMASPPGLVAGVSIGTDVAAGASPMKALRSADELGRHPGSRFNSSAAGTETSAGRATGSGAGVAAGAGVGAARSLPGTGTTHPPLNEEEPLPLRSAGAGPTQPGLPHSISAGVLSPQTTGGTTATNTDSVRSRRGPVLLRGGFGDPSAAISRSSAASSPSHSPVRDLGLGRGVGLGINRGAGGDGQGQGQVQAGSSVPCRGSSISERLRSGTAGEDDENGNGNGNNSWRGSTQIPSGLGRRASAISATGFGGPGISGYPGLPLSSNSSSTTNANASPAMARGKERRTAPSSLGRDRDRHLQGEGDAQADESGSGAGRARSRRVGSDVGVGGGGGGGGGVLGSRLSEESEVGEIGDAIRGLNLRSGPGAGTGTGTGERKEVDREGEGF
ncbi:hypothetical protein IAT40_002761 [Kwoniella sp. CBS 6097]